MKIKIIDKYIAKQLTTAILLVALALLGVDLLFYLINELRFVGKGNYDLLAVFKFISLTIPRKLYILFPWSALLGTLLALGMLAKSSELVAMRVAAISIHRISWAVLKAALLLTICVFIIGEIINPISERYAQQQKSIALSSGQAISTEYGTWVRNRNEFIHIGNILSDGKLLNITRYQLDKNLVLQNISNAQTAYFDKDLDKWILNKVKSTRLAEIVDVIETDQLEVEDLIEKNILQASTVKHLERLSMLNLWRVITNRMKNELNTKDYELAFWSKVFQPLAILVMVYLAIPFVFGPLRSASLSLKLLTGIIVGFVFHTFNSVLAPLIVVINLPPFLAAGLPTVIFAAIGIGMMSRVR